jgi:hypothetical protein
MSDANEYIAGTFLAYQTDGGVCHGSITQT